MSAPSNAITLLQEAKIYWDDTSDIEIMKIPVKCSCGWKGLLIDLLCDPDDPEPANNDFWCPLCETKAWEFI